MTPLGIGPRDALALVRHAQRVDLPGPLLVTGVLAEQLAAALAAGGDRALVATSGDPASAVALVRVVAGAATPDDEAQLRAASRALVPVVAVQTRIATVPLPYVHPVDVVDCPPGSGFPVDVIAETLARVLGKDGVQLGARLPVLRPAFERRRLFDGVVSAGALATLTRHGGPHLPLLSLAQARMLSDLATVSGAAPPGDPRAAAQSVAPRLAAALATGVLARALVRRLPLRGRLVDGAAAAASTFALGLLVRRLGSVRSGS